MLYNIYLKTIYNIGHHVHGPMDGVDCDDTLLLLTWRESDTLQCLTTIGVRCDDITCCRIDSQPATANRPHHDNQSLGVKARTVGVVLGERQIILLTTKFN